MGARHDRLSHRLMARAFFEQLADALASFLPPDLRRYEAQIGGRNIKVWFGEDRHEHYEVQMLSRRAGNARLEIGFHAEHPAATRNDDALERLRARERAWRRTLGAEPEAGRFRGRQTEWRRLSEVWDGPGLETDEAAVEAAERLARYIEALERLRAR
ncbi:MAG: hypothetical protein ACXVQY_10910 [Actinomycetota bacterium]